MNAKYKSYGEIRKERIEARRNEAEATLRHAAGAAQARGARLLVFGSFIEGGFHERSDLDVGLFNAPTGGDIELAVEIDTFIRTAGFDTDVIPERFMPPSLRERIVKHGAEYGPLGRH